jgi:Flp pilus assembly pilin Flp
MIAVIRELARDESGGALIEYALVLALVSMAGFAALSAFGDVLESFFATSSTDLALVAQQAK